MNVETIIAAATVLGVLFTIWLAYKRHTTSITAWRAQVTQTLEGIHETLQELKSDGADRDRELNDMQKALTKLAETAGRALGRTEGN